ncbi:MAG TPA: hypothetical protein VF719_10205 [Abditibacteriaceae bacterium]
MRVLPGFRFLVRAIDLRRWRAPSAQVKKTADAKVIGRLVQSTTEFTIEVNVCVSMALCVTCV